MRSGPRPSARSLSRTGRPCASVRFHATMCGEEADGGSGRPLPVRSVASAGADEPTEADESATRPLSGSTGPQRDASIRTGPHERKADERTEDR
jgi:hypothetical protein